jgi:hypothetical protein
VGPPSRSLYGRKPQRAAGSLELRDGRLGPDYVLFVASPIEHSPRFSLLLTALLRGWHLLRTSPSAVTPQNLLLELRPHMS